MISNRINQYTARGLVVTTPCAPFYFFFKFIPPFLNNKTAQVWRSAVGPGGRAPPALVRDLKPATFHNY